MKKCTLFAAGIVAGLFFVASSVQAQQKGFMPRQDAANKLSLTSVVQPHFSVIPMQTPLKASGMSEDILVDEDFSGFTAGTTMRPDTIHYLASQYHEPGIYIDPSLTHGVTWGGNQVFSAGGAAYLWQPNAQSYALLNTPLGDYSGDITVTLKVKAMRAWIPTGYNEDGSLQWGWLTGSGLTVSAMVGGYERPQYADTDLPGNMYSVRLYEDKGWTKVTVTFKNYSADNDGFIMLAVDGAALIDDVMVTTQLTDFLASPKIVGVTDFQKNQFTIKWQPVRKAFNYYVDLYKKVYTSDTEGTFHEDFESFSVLQEGWASTSNALSDEGSNGSKGLLMHQGDTLTLPNNGGTYTAANFYLHADDPEVNREDPYWKWYFPGQLTVDVLTNTGWKELGNFPAGYYVEQGDTVRMAEQMKNFANQYQAIRLRATNLSATGYIVLDDIDVTTNRPSKLVAMTDGSNIEDIMEENYNMLGIVKGTEYTFTDLDPETEYYYSVRSHYVYDFSKRIAYHALGVVAPQVDVATEIDSRGSFTANWQAAPKAQSYEVNLYGVYTAAADETDHAILEEDFNLINDDVTSATDTTAPESLGNYQEVSFDDYTVLPGWKGLGNTLVQGMLGCEEAYYTTLYIQTPVLDVNNSDMVNVTVKAYGTAEDLLVFNIDGMSYAVPFDANGVFDGTLQLPVSSATIQPQISSYNNRAFILDYIRFGQDLKKGDVVKSPLQIQTTDGLNFTFNNLSDYNFEWFGYDVCSLFELEGESTKSKKSALMLVDLENGTSQPSAIGGVTAINGGAKGQQNVEAIFSADGRRQKTMQKGLNIVKMSDGTVRKLLVK